MNTVETGRLGEQHAASHLKQKGYRILCCNFRARRCKIDIIARKHNTLVFVEVKTRGVKFCDLNNSPKAPQIKRLIYAANSFLKTCTTNTNSCRFDLIRVVYNKKSVKGDRLKEAFDISSFLI